jgi:hypothetical protein
VPRGFGIRYALSGSYIPNVIIPHSPVKMAKCGQAFPNDPQNAAPDATHFGMPSLDA